MWRCRCTCSRTRWAKCSTHHSTSCSRSTTSLNPISFFLSHERAAKVLTEQNARGAPELVVEIASTSTRRRDETIKRRLYERDGVSEYWLVDPELDSIRVYRREGDRFGRAVELTSERADVLTTPLLPGLEIVLTGIFVEPGGSSQR